MIESKYGIMVDTRQVFVAATVADRINNGEYVKLLNGYGPNHKNDNKALMNLVLSGQITITPEDEVRTNLIMDYARGFTLKLLTDTASDFERNVLKLVERDQISIRTIGWIACLPSMYAREANKIRAQEMLMDAKPEYLASVDEHISVRATAIRSVFSHQYNCYWTTALTETNHMVFFSQSKDPLKQGVSAKISGRVRAHRDEYRTQLTRVKVVI